MTSYIYKVHRNPKGCCVDIYETENGPVWLTVYIPDSMSRAQLKSELATVLRSEVPVGLWTGLLQAMEI